MGSLKTSIMDLILPGFLRGIAWNDLPSSYSEGVTNADYHKAWCGFNNKLTAMFLCPEGHIEDMKAVRNCDLRTLRR